MSAEEKLPLTMPCATREELLKAIREVVQARWGAPPAPVKNHDLFMRFESTPITMDVEWDPPMITIAGRFVESEKFVPNVLEIVNLLNGKMRPYLFKVDDDGLSVVVYVQGLPLVPDHLYIALSLITDLVGELGQEIAESVGGTIVTSLGT